MDANDKISVVVPIFNESANITELQNRLSDTLQSISSEYEIIYVNDGSSDDSLERLKRISENDKNTFYLSFSRNFGHQIAVTAGLDVCRGNPIIIMDGDLQDPPELISQLYEKYKMGYEVVYAKRKERKGESVFKKITAKMFYRLLKNLTSINIPLDTGDFRLIDRKIVGHLKLMTEQNKFLRGQIAWIGFRQAEVLFDRQERKEGKTGYSFSKMLRFAVHGIVNFSDKPLQFVTKLGLLISLVSLIIILYALYSNFILHRTITGWTSLIISSMFIGGTQLLSIGIIGEYISNINKNVQNRPLYIVEDSNIQ